MSVNEVKIKKATEPFVVRGSGSATSRTFCIGDEDHTIGNALRHILIQNSSVGFVGYSVPHPSEPIVQIRVQTIKGGTNNVVEQKQEEMTAIDALRGSCQTLFDQCDIVMEQLEEIIPEVREDRIRMENLLLDEEEDGEEAYDEAEAGDDFDIGE
jgi:DNA-directed RNA polymerases I and III subunit RPAC2